MPRIDPQIMTHKLNVNPSFKPMKQKMKRLAPEKNQAINEDVDQLMENKMIQDVQYPGWLANAIVVKKKNGKNRVPIDFTDLNDACSNDSFPLLINDQLVDATIGHEVMSFLDAFSRYNQILMHLSDYEKTSLMT